LEAFIATQCRREYEAVDRASLSACVSLSGSS
jgi:hypothetical protein